MPHHSGVRFLGACLLVVVVFAFAAAEPFAQSVGYKRRSANGREFPSWEREVDSSVPPPLPVAAKGRHVLELSFRLDLPATGVVALRNGALAVPLIDGRVQLLDTSGELLREVALEEATAHAPLAAGELAVVTAGTTVAGVGVEGLAWKQDLPGPPAWSPVLRPAGVVVTLQDGRALLLDPVTGERLWLTEPDAALRCGPAQAGELLVWGTRDGRLLARRVSDASLAWSRAVGETVATVGGDADSVFFVAEGRTGRSKKSVGPFLGRLAVDGGKPELRWRSRVGGGSDVEPILLGSLVAFPCHDGYLHALERGDGGLAWRTDLPARLAAGPRLVGGRLDVLIPFTGWAVAVAADNGAVMGWTELPDEDETFVGPAATRRGYTFAATSFGRLVGLRWEYEREEG